MRALSMQVSIMQRCGCPRGKTLAHMHDGASLHLGRLAPALHLEVCMIKSARLECGA